MPDLEFTSEEGSEDMSFKGRFRWLQGSRISLQNSFNLSNCLWIVLRAVI
jgi:hypothetical protein